MTTKGKMTTEELKLEIEKEQAKIDKFNEWYKNCSSELYGTDEGHKIEEEWINSQLDILQAELKGRIESIEEIKKMIDECSVPVMDEEEMDKFIEQNQESSIYRIINFDKLKSKLEKNDN